MGSYSDRLIKNSARLTAGLLCLIVCGCAGKSAPQPQATANKSLNQPIATVNGHPILAKTYEMYLKNGRDALGLDDKSEEGRRRLDQLREGIVSELIDRTLIRDESARRGLTLTPETLTNAERKTIAELGGDQQYDAYLVDHGFTRDEYREIIKSEIYGELLRNELNKGLSVSDAEVRKYYAEHQTDAQFQQPERVTAAHILVAARPTLITQRLQNEKNLSGEALAAAVREEMERLRQRAQELRRKAVRGADFAALARESSDDAGTRDRGGDLGAFQRQSHAPAFDEAAFAIKVGQISDVVQTDFGFHIIKKTKHEPARTQTFTEAEPEIRKLLHGRLEAQNLADWLKDARRKANIRIEEPYRFGALKTEFP
jgi:parvulin-like peptidyl-prolyl isomerase